RRTQTPQSEFRPVRGGDGWCAGRTPGRTKRLSRPGRDTSHARTGPGAGAYRYSPCRAPVSRRVDCRVRLLRRGPGGVGPPLTWGAAGLRGKPTAGNQGPRVLARGRPSGDDGNDGRRDRPGSRPAASRGGAMSTENAPVKRRVVLTGISSRAWEHPADKGAMAALRELRGFDDVLKALSGIWDERAWRMMFLGGAIRSDHRQHPRVHRLFAEAAATLDVTSLPELYVEMSPLINAQCVGMTKPFIVVTSAAVAQLDDEELRYILGHEIGHMLSGHAVYRTMMLILRNLATNLAWLPIGSIALRGIIAALQEWWRKAELSADRAGLLAGQDTSAALRAHMKMAG